ncbi:MAG: helix-turn-helix domain-containing protein [Verrucomicrobiota bacterium]
MLLHQLTIPLSKPQAKKAPEISSAHNRAVERLCAVARIRGTMLKGVSLSSAARTQGLPVSTAWRWLSTFEVAGFEGLIPKTSPGRPRTRPVAQRRPIVYELHLRRRKERMAAESGFKSSRPLLAMPACITLLDCTSDQVCAWIDSGELLYSWDIRTANARKREIRVWIMSVLAKQYRLPQPSETHEQVLSALFPEAVQQVTSTQIQRVLSASQDHVARLIEAGLLKGMNEPKRGRGGAVMVTRHSVIEFLRERLIA